VFADQLQAALDDTSKINYWLVAAVVVLFAVVILLVRRWFNKTSNEQLRSGKPLGSGIAGQPGSLKAAPGLAFHPRRGRSG
jgi:hypothetical protein